MYYNTNTYYSSKIDVLQKGDSTTEMGPGAGKDSGVTIGPADPALQGM